MKIHATLEFDLEDESGVLIDERKEYVWAAEATDDAIRSRLMGAGFLSDDTMIGSYTLDVVVIGGFVDDGTEAGQEAVPDSAALASEEFDGLIDDATHAVNNLIPDHALSRLSDGERTALLHAINDALTPVLGQYIPINP